MAAITTTTRGEGAAEEALAELRERLVVDAGREVGDGLLDLTRGVGLLEPLADDRPAVEVADGGGQLVAEVAGLLHRRRRHQQHDGREEQHHAAADDPRRRDARPAEAHAARSADSGDRATPSTTPTATFVTMSGAIVTIAQTAAARAAAAGDQPPPTPGGRRRAAPEPGASRPHPPRTASSPSVRYGGMPSATGTVERRSYRLTGAAALTDRRHHRRAGRAQARCSSPPTDRSPGRSPPSRPPCCSTRSSIAWPCTSVASRRCCSPSSPSAPSAWAPPTSCSTRSSRPSTASRRRPRRRPTPSRTATTGSASWPATSSSASASTTPSTRSTSG